MTTTHFISLTPAGIQTALTLTVDPDGRLILKKGDGFAKWRADTTPVVVGNSLLPKRDADMAALVDLIREWLDAEETEQ